MGGREEDGRVLNDHFEIGVHVVEYEADVGLVTVDVQQADDIRVVQLLQEFDFPERGSVYAVHGVGLLPYFDLLHGDDGVSVLRVFCLEYGGILAFAEELCFVITFRHLQCVSV